MTPANATRHREAKSQPCHHVAASPATSKTGLLQQYSGFFLIALLAVTLVSALLWRIGVREGERTALVTQGWFSVVRDPIFSAMALTGAGLAFMVPNAVSIGGLVLLLVALQLQVRVVEEPYLRVLNGAAYTSYEQSVGRFVPLLGRRHSNA